jgi:hypothetical protein
MEGKMPNFWFAVACNKPRLRDPAQVLGIIGRYWFDFDCAVAIENDTEGQSRLSIDGDGWPAAWPLPPGISAEDYYPDYPTLGQEEFEAFLSEVAAFLMDPLVVQAIGTVNGRFPLSACEWRLAPCSTAVAKIEFTSAAESAAPLTLATA